MARHRILLPVPTGTNPEYNARSWPNYAAAIEASGGEAIRLEMTSSAAKTREALRSCAGVVLPGSPADVDPVRFGAAREPETTAADPLREAADWTILEEAERSGAPLLGICYGVQSLNVYRGGTLLQDLSPVPVNHAAGKSVMVAHSADIAAESFLARVLEDTEAIEQKGFLRLPVNSSHHQALSVPGAGLKVVARCAEDGVIEAVEGDADGWFVLGVQWHPERSYESSAASRALFRRLIVEAGRR